MDFKNCINEFNEIEEQFIKKIINIKDLEIKKEYNIKCIEKIRSKYGPSIIVGLETYKIFLPKRFVDKLDDKANTQFKKSKFIFNI